MSSADDEKKQYPRNLEIIAQKLQLKIDDVLVRLDIPAYINPNHLRRSIQHRGNDDGTVDVGSDLPYAPHVEYGTLPHTPPFDAIHLWVQKKLKMQDPEAENVAWAIVNHISKNGTNATRFMRVSAEEFRVGL